LKKLKSFEHFIIESEFNEVNEFNLNLFGSFKKFLKNIKKDKDEDFIDDIEIMNPETKGMIKLSSALSYDKKSKVKQLADMAMAELKDNVKDAKAVSPEQKISFQFNKQLKKRKEQSKEWGEDWTQDDEKALKSEIIVNQIDSMKGEKKQALLKKALENVDDDRLLKLDKRVDNDSAEQIYKSIGDVDKYFADESGKGHNITQSILRSKSATLKQRENAIMFDWVMGSDSAGALMASQHMIDKLKMGKGAQDGFKYRDGKGETFAEKPGGNLSSEVEKENIKAIDDIYQKTQDYYKEKGIKTVKVYRGTDSENPSEKYKNPMESWTTERAVAAQYGEFIQEKEFPVERVMMGSFDKNFPDPYDSSGNPSKEIVILGQ